MNERQKANSKDRTGYVFYGVLFFAFLSGFVHTLLGIGKMIDAHKTAAEIYVIAMWTANLVAAFSGAVVAASHICLIKRGEIKNRQLNGGPLSLALYISFSLFSDIMAIAERYQVSSSFSGDIEIGGVLVATIILFVVALALFTASLYIDWDIYPVRKALVHFLGYALCIVAWGINAVSAFSSGVLYILFSLLLLLAIMLGCYYTLIHISPKCDVFAHSEASKDEG